MSSRRPMNDYYAGSDRNTIEDENSRMTEELAGRVRRLKDLTIEIGDEVKQQKGLLEQLSEGFFRSSGLLGGNMTRLNKIANSPGSCRTILYTVLFAFCVFFFCWILYKFKG